MLTIDDMLEQAPEKIDEIVEASLKRFEASLIDRGVLPVEIDECMNLQRQVAGWRAATLNDFRRELENPDIESTALH